MSTALNVNVNLVEENVNQTWNNNKCPHERKKRNLCEKDYIWNRSTYSCEYWKYLASIMDDSVIMWGEVINSYDDKTKTIPKNFNEKKATCETQNFYILLAFLLITIALLIAVSIYCYLIKYWAKQKTFITISRHK